MGASANSPKLRPKRKSTTLKHLFDLDSKAGAGDGDGDGDGGFACALPRPPSSPESNAEELVEAISLCGSRVFTFTDPSESPSDRDAQRARLLRVLSAVRSARRPLPPGILRPLFALLSANLFRPLPPPASPCCPHPPESLLVDDDSPVASLAPPWPHLSIAYDILSAAVSSAEQAALREHAGRGFLSGLAALFDSEDPRERDRLKGAYHQLYAKLTGERAFMRRSMRDALLAERQCGVGELLEIWASVIDGFAVPLKEEHRALLRRVLVPLHRPKGMGAYHRQLSYCVMQFVRKEPALADAVARGLLRCWPRTSSHKEVLMIGELEELLELLDLPLSGWGQNLVAERALYVWNNEQFVKMASCLMQEILPPTVDSIEKNLKTHWSKSVRQLTTSVKNMLEEMEPELYAKCLEEINQRESAIGREASKREVRWERLEMAAVNNQLLRPPSICV
ncbi:Serine/threonine protein phosphatase 2A 57 kDa regulatory subunit B' theta isoform [Ananas comosus]|uniref:Serine/threonine protein phosphatase 2A 57 kDa regulatory subunit B' theta isoform n=1 Tax=Ananas comosus TaxID=4615 RepID=A0A199VL13_ANACO|nr:Serine/threonine protein phosphatase 2A 57 kDa regulatory subunit B' theta isoform [Ananas comosus]